MNPSARTRADEVIKGFEIAENQGSSKIMSLGDAVSRFVHPGDCIHVAYADARPNAAILEVVRQFYGTSPKFTLVTAGLVSTQHALVETGLVTRILTSFAGENFPSPRPSSVFQAAVREKRTVVENWSLWSIVARLMAGALGVPFLPIQSLRDSTMAIDNADLGYQQIPDPFGGPEVGVVRALRPDIVLLQGAVADDAGNVMMSAPYGEGYWGSMASKGGVIACVERVVSTQEIRDNASTIRIPAHVVKAVCHTPFGSHPYGFYSPGLQIAGYVQDDAFIREISRSTPVPGGFSAWIDEWVLGTRTHQGYLEKLGAERLDRLTAAADPQSWRADVEPALERAGNETYSESELLVVMAARQIKSRVRAGGFSAVLAGVGQSNLACWQAVVTLKRENVDIELMSEIGMFGYEPRPGEPFIFAHRNLPTSKMLTDTTAVLGTFVSGPGTKTLGVIGAGQVDGAGNANSTYTNDGDYLVGSGGANDITSAADEVLITVMHGRGRLVAALPYITCPGRNVASIVTSAGIFERCGERFVLARYASSYGEDAVSAIAAIRSECGWEFDVAEDLSVEADPTRGELQMVRLFDPAGVFVKSTTHSVVAPSVQSAVR